MEISQKLVDEGYVSKTKHPDTDLWVYNYTQKAQFEGRTGLWEQYPELLQCRGLILDKEGNIVARPFKKFFNFEEYTDGVPPYKSFEIYDKLDGSLGIVYPLNGKACVATRGSFTSEQAIWATQFLNVTYPEFCKRYIEFERSKLCSYLFEIIYPENRIVVDYKGKSDLVLLTIINNETGKDCSRDTLELSNMFWKFTIVEKFADMKDFSRVRELIKRDNAEGFVVIFDTGLRVKLKYEEYVRLHRIVTGVSTKTIWEMLRDDQSFDEVLECVPDEFHEWVEKTKTDLEEQYKRIETSAVYKYGEVGRIVDLESDPKEARKKMATVILRDAKPLAPVIFALLDNKPIEKIIWKMIRPKFRQPFQTKESV